MTVLVLFGVPVYIVLVYLAVQLVRRISQRRWPVVVVLVLAIAWPVGDAMWPKWVISNYCDNEGPFIREVVENVEGFYLGGSEGCDRNCFYALMDRQGNNIRFVEAHVSAKTFRNNGAPVPAKIYEKGYAPGPGLYRFTREKAGHPNCKIYDRVLARTPRDQSDLHYVENCIATWPIYEVTATYEVSRSFEVNKLSFGVIEKFFL